MAITLLPAKKKGVSRYNLAYIAEDWLKSLFSGSNAVKSMKSRRPVAPKSLVFVLVW